MRVWLVGVLIASACGSGGGGTGDDQPDPDGGMDGSDGGTDPGWTTLIERGWQLPSNGEAFKCIRVKIPSDTYISAFRVKTPPGTHHSLLTISTTTTSPIGSYECDATNTDMNMLFAGGIGTDDLVFPAGVAIKLPANTYINLNLHVANYTDQAMSCTPPACSSGIQIKTLTAAEVMHEAEAVFLGSFNITIPPMSVDHMVANSCSVPATWTLLDLWPHMHEYATRQRVKVRRAANSQVQTLLDQPYTYTEQKNYPMTNAVILPNDELQIECLYTNPTANTIYYGEIASQEMCFAGFYKYPATGINKYFCSQ